MSELQILRRDTLITHEIEIKRSRFITTLARTDTPIEGRALIDSVKSEHPQARHNCSAWMIHEDGHSPSQHSSDDGEPSGTAGAPMLEALRLSNTWNVTAVVTRYFGGILLGAGGLVRAYSTAISETLALAPRSIRSELHVLEAALPISEAGRIEAELRHAGAHVLDTVWGHDVTLRIGATPDDVPTFDTLMAHLTSGACAFRYVGTQFVEMDA